MRDVLEFWIQCRCSKWPPSASKHCHNLFQRYWWVKSVYILLGHSVLFIFVILYNATGMSHLKVMCLFFSVLYRFLHRARSLLWTPYFTQYSEWPGEICQSWNSEVERHVMIYMLWHEKWSWVKWQWVGLHKKLSNGLAPFFLWARVCVSNICGQIIYNHPSLFNYAVNMLAYSNTLQCRIQYSGPFSID